MIETTAQNVGHWTCLLRYGDTTEFFDSYGKKMDYQKNTLISPEKNREFGQTENYLSNLLNKSSFNAVYNKKQLQLFKNESETCDRWCINRLECLMDINIYLQQYIRYIRNALKTL